MQARRDGIRAIHFAREAMIPSEQQSPSDTEVELSSGRNTSSHRGDPPSRHSLPTGPSTDEIRRKPWKFLGYSAYSRFIASVDDFFILRRFDDLTVRVGLALQDHIAQLEESLKTMDDAYSDVQAEDAHNGTFRDDAEERTSLLDELAARLCEYRLMCRTEEFLLRQSALRKLPQAPRRDVKSIQNWHYNFDRSAIAHAEQAYLDQNKDLVSVVHRDKTPVRQMIDSSHFLRTLGVWKRRPQNAVDNTAADSEPELIQYFSDRRMDSFASVVIVTIGVTMLIAPLWILMSLDGPKTKLAVITVFISIFLLILSFAMVAKPFEALAATAAYAAVLVVFLEFGDPT